jgi:hypothetical protein
MYFDKSRKKKEVTSCLPVVFLIKNFLGNINGMTLTIFKKNTSSFFQKNAYHSIAIKRRKKHKCTQNFKTGIGPIFF